MRRALLAAAIVLLAVSAAMLVDARTGAGRREVAAAAPLPAPPPGAPLATAVFAGGCFWGVEAVFEHLRGVQSATSGYAGGTEPSPSYEQVSSGRTGHAESVRVVYDPSQIAYETLLEVFFRVAHDPTQLDRQGPDVGPHYRSAIFYGSEGERKAAEAYVAELTRSKLYDGPIVTQLAPLDRFYEAEVYHQDYMARHPNQLYIVVHDRPKLERLRKEYPQLYREPTKG